MKKKICYIVSTLRRLGPTHQLFYIAKNLNRTQFEPHVITLSPETNDTLWPEFEKENIQLHSLSLSRLAGVFKAKSNLEKLLSVIQPDIIHTQGVRADHLSSTLIQTSSKICTVRNYPQLDYSMTYGKFLGAILTKVQVRAFQKMNMCVAVSKAVETNLKTHFHLPNTTTIHNGVDVSLYSKSSLQTKQELRKQFGIPLDAFVWITTMGKDRRKDTNTIASAFANQYQNNQKHHLILLGDGNLKISCQKITQNTNNTTYTGRVNNVSDYFNMSDCFVSASLAEGFPNAVLEAMASGLSLLLSDIPPHQEIISICQKPVGMTFLKRNAQDLQTKMAQFSSTAGNWGGNAFDHIQSHLAAESVSKKYQDLYLKLCDS